LLTTAKCALLTSQGSLRGAIEAGIVNRVPFTISPEGLQARVNADIRMGACRRGVFSLCLSLTDDEGIPVAIRTQDKMDGLRCALYWAVQLDLNGLTHLGSNDEVFLIFMPLGIFAVLPQLNAMPLVALIKSGEAHLHSKFFAGKKPFE